LGHGTTTGDIILDPDAPTFIELEDGSEGASKTLIMTGTEYRSSIQTNPDGIARLGFPFRMRLSGRKGQSSKTMSRWNFWLHIVGWNAVDKANLCLFLDVAEAESWYAELGTDHDSVLIRQPEPPFNVEKTGP
jgi:hypothetical protein